MKIVVVGDAMIPARFIAEACDRFDAKKPEVARLSWLGEDDKVRLQEERIKVEKGGPGAVPLPEGLVEAVSGAGMLFVHYCPVSHEIMDAAYNDMWARKIAAGEPFAEGSYFRAPLYFWFLGLLYKVSGTDYFVIRLVQSVLGSLSCALVYLIGRRALGRTVSGIAALACSTSSIAS